MTDPIADLLTRIRNAVARGHKTTIAPYSKMKESILSILKKEGFIMGYSIQEDGVRKDLVIDLKYVNNKPMITDLKRISKPGVRKYVGYKNIPRVKRGLGLAIITTSNGVMTGRQARKEKAGGELICTIS